MRESTAAVLLGLLLALGAGVPDPSHAAGPDESAAVLKSRLAEPRPINLDEVARELELLGPDEAVEQLRDWAMIAAVGQLDLTGPEVDWFRLVGGLPPLSRWTYAAGLREWPHGPGRIAVLGPSEYLVLAPAVKGRFDLAVASRLLDERRMIDGRTPERVHVVAYTCDPARTPAELSIAYAGTFSGRAFESPTSGFVVTRVSDLESLAIFLRQADDLLEVRYAEDGSVLLTGRRYDASRYARPYHRIDPADLAVIRRSQGETPGEEARSVSNLGFSLDPWINPRPLAEALRRLADSPDPLARANRAPILETAALLASRDPFPTPDSPEADTTRVFALAEALDRARGPRIATPDEPAPPSLRELVHEHSFQAPRYMGAIRGTEVGMTLYYTDLMAKLFAMGAVVGPDGQIVDLTLPDLGGAAMHPMLAVPLAAFDLEEANRLNNGRLWWAPRSTGFLRLADDTIRFAPVATTLFMKSKAGQTAEEVDANLRGAAFCGAWNRAYLDAADAHPEYHRLNQIMKWSVVLLAAEERGDAAWSCLDNVPASPGQSFRAWYDAGRADGRLAGPDHLPFLDPAPGPDDDALALLRSKPFTERSTGQVVSTHFLTGGVDTATPEQISDRTVPDGSAPPPGIIPGIRVTDLPPDGEGGGRRYALEEGGVLRTGEDERDLVFEGNGDPIRIPGLAIQADGDTAPAVHTRAETRGPEGGIILASAIERGGTVVPTGDLTVMADGRSPGLPRRSEIRIRRTRRGPEEVLALAERVARGLELEPEAFYSPDRRRLYLPVGEGEDRRWLEASLGDEVDDYELEVGEPGSSIWYRITERGPSEIPPESGRVPADGPQFTIAELDPESGRPRVSPCWLTPTTRASKSLSIHGEPGTLAVTPEGALIAMGKAPGGLLGRLTLADLDRLRAAFDERGATTSVWLEGPGYRLDRGASDWVARPGAAPDPSPEIRISDRGTEFFGRDRAELERVRQLLQDPALDGVMPDRGWTNEAEIRHRRDLVLAAGRAPWGVADGPDGFTITPGDSGPTIDLGDLVARTNRNQPWPEAIANRLRSGPIVLDVSHMPADRLTALADQVGTVGLDAVYWSGLAGASDRLAGLARPGPSIEVRGDASLLRVNRFGQFLLDLVGRGLRLDGEGGSRLQLLLGHNDGQGSFADEVRGRLAQGEFGGDHVVLVVCNIDHAEMIGLRDALLKGGAASVTYSVGLMDPRAVGLALGYLERNPDLIDRATPNVLPRRLYDEVRQTLIHCRDSFEPAGAYRAAFGDRAAEGLLLRDGQPRDWILEIQPILDSLILDGRRFFPHVDRREPPRTRLAA